MEEKRQKIRNFIWPVFSLGNFHKFFSVSPTPSKNSGFTLIEVLIVIAVIGVLAAGLVMVIDPISQLEKSKDKTRKADLKLMQSALELYYADNGEYPCFGDNDNCGWYILSGVDINHSEETGEGNKLGVVYLKEIPEGPRGDESCNSDPYYGYVYSVHPDRKSYSIFTNLENESDEDALGAKPPPAVCPSGDRRSWCSTDNRTASWNVTSCPGTYKYWVNSPIL